MHPIDTIEFVLAERGTAGLGRVTSLPAGAPSLSIAIEFASVRWAHWRDTGEDIHASLRQGVGITALDSLLSTRSGSALLALSAMQTGDTVFPSFSEGEVCDVPLADEWAVGGPFMLFQERFKTALRQRGASSELAHALVGAFAEMASNAAEHAGAAIPPVATFETSAATWAFSVTDVGCGVVESLKRNPDYATVADGRTALSHALRHGVSGTGKPGRGTGFTTLFKALIDRHCTIRFRSADVAAACSATSPTATSLGFLVLPPRRGFHVAVQGHCPPVGRKNPR